MDVDISVTLLPICEKSFFSSIQQFDNLFQQKLNQILNSINTKKWILFNSFFKQ